MPPKLPLKLPEKWIFFSIFDLLKKIDTIILIVIEYLYNKIIKFFNLFFLNFFITALVEVYKFFHNKYLIKLSSHIL